MTPEQINEAVAKKLGRDSASKVPGYYYFQPSTDISAAWEIVEHLYSKGLVSILTNRSGVWAVSIDSARQVEAQSHANTAPMAICLAFLKMQEEK